MKIQIDKILCPVDFSDSSEHAIGYAMAFAETHQAELKFLHVMDYSTFDIPDFPSVVEFSSDIIDQIREGCEKRLVELARTQREDYSEVTCQLTMGTPFVEIINTAREDETDLIIMGTHGRSGLAHVLMGSVAAKVVRKSPCPVLTVKHPEHEFILP